MKYVGDASGTYFQLFGTLWEEMSSVEEETQPNPNWIMRSNIDLDA
jgi:hypothetical protein